MIALFSTAVDQSTTDVLRWIRRLSPGTAVIRVNSDEPDRVTSLSITNSEFRFVIDGTNLSSRDLTTVWYRKGRDWLCNVFLPVDAPVAPRVRQYLAAKIRAEERRLTEFAHAKIAERAWSLGDHEQGDLNKLMVLDLAATCGLDVPRLLISNSKQEIRAIVEDTEAVTKALSDGLYLFDHEIATRGYYSYTEELKREQLDALPPRISPSLTQVRIPKVLEIRVFFLNGRFYPMAIFSQADDRTRIDFRRYNETRPNRSVPYRLPGDVEARLLRLFEELCLNTGSADMILEPDGRYVFLEINPSGQFGMVSAPCNYYLEREVASTLISHEQLT